MNKKRMLLEIALNTFDDAEKGRYFAMVNKDVKTLEEVKALYELWQSGTKDKQFFVTELIGYTPAKRERYLKRLEK